MPLKVRVALVDRACEELFRRIEADARRRAALGPLADIPTEALRAFRDAFAKASGAGPAKLTGAVVSDKEMPPLGGPHAAESNSQ
jgi:hypothetical protein